MNLRGIHLGDPRGVLRAVEKAEQGQNVVLAFLGGSITQGSLSSKPTTCYAYLVYKWWKKTFPHISVTYINAGIGGTSSLFGVARVQEDVLAYNPDFIILDFTVNDENTDFFLETYESLVVRILSSKANPGVMALCNAYYEDGRSAFERHEKVLNHYDIPYVSIKETLYQDILDGTIAPQEITLDGLHPSDYGHKRIADFIIAALEAIKEMKLDFQDKVEMKPLPATLTSCSYKDASRIQNNIIPLLSKGFLPDDSIKDGVTDVFKKGWLGYHEGDRIVFEVEGSCLLVQYKRTVKRPGPIAVAYLDGDRDQGVILDGTFDEDWGDCLTLTSLLHHGKLGKHVIEIEVVKEVIGEDKPFYLVSILQSGNEGV
jgi:lysophospholipase L1-like esterase